MKTPEKEAATATRIRAVKSSLRAFALSLIGLVPVIGLPFALVALVEAFRAPRVCEADWNPALRYLNAAKRLAPLSLVSTVLFLVTMFGLLPAALNDFGGCATGGSS